MRYGQGNCFWLPHYKKGGLRQKIRGDGCIHLVPVEWIEYIPVYKHTDIEICALDEAKELSYAEKARQAVKEIKDKKI